AMHQVVLDVTAACGDRVDVEVVQLASDGGAFTYPADVAACDTRTGTDLTLETTTLTDIRAFTVPDPGSATSIVGVAPQVPRLAERVILRIEGFFQSATARLLLP